MQAIGDEFIAPSYDKPRKSRTKHHIANRIRTRVLENIPLKSKGNNFEKSGIIFAVSHRERQSNSLVRLVRTQLEVKFLT